MSIPSTRTTLKNYCLRKLGAPVINVNVADEQVQDLIDDAIQMFLKYHHDGSEEQYIIHEVTQEDVDTQSFQLPKEILSVTEIQTRQSSGGAFNSGIFDVEYQIHQSDFLNSQGIYSFSGGSLTNYYLIRRSLNLLESLFSPDFRFEYNRISNTIRMNGALKTVGSKIVLKCYISFTLDTNGDMTHTNAWNDDWFKKYTTALIKRQWGSNMKKFQGVTLLGNVTMDGQTIYNEAVSQIQELEQQLKDEFQLPVDFYIGGVILTILAKASLFATTGIIV